MSPFAQSLMSKMGKPIELGGRIVVLTMVHVEESRDGENLKCEFELFKSEEEKIDREALYGTSPSHELVGIMPDLPRLTL